MKPEHYTVNICIVILVMVFCVVQLVFGADAGNTNTAESVTSESCPGIDYQGDTCLCAPQKQCEKCTCVNCAGGENCKCITAIRESSGTIVGSISVFRTKVKTKGSKSYKDVVVYLEKVGDNSFPLSLKPVRMDQKGLVYIPHVLAIQKGTNVEFLNNDNDKHNVYFVNDKTSDTKDLGTWQPGESRHHKFQGPEFIAKERKPSEPQVFITLCKLHLEMAAYVVVLDNPFFTTASIDGETQKAQYSIKNIPPGKYQLNIWHKKLKLKGGSKEIIVEQGKATTTNLEITKAKYAKLK